MVLVRKISVYRLERIRNGIQHFENMVSGDIITYKFQKLEFQ